MKDMVRLTVRIPRDLHVRLGKEVKEKPHLSQNAVIVEAIERGMK